MDLFIFLSNFFCFLSLSSSFSSAGWKIQGAMMLVHSMRAALAGANRSSNHNQLDRRDNAWDPAFNIIRSWTTKKKV